MTEPVVLAEITWLTPEQGGRTHLPSGPRYVTVARFWDGADRDAEDSWSLIVEFIEPPAYGTARARVRLLVPEAPSEVLCPDCRFDLLEGHRVVAHGLIVSAPAS